MSILKNKPHFLICSLIILFYSSTFAAEYTPLDITDGMWEVQLNFEDMLTPKQMVQMKKALAALEQMKKTNPAIAAQMAKSFATFGVKGTSVTKKNCFHHSDMKNQMNKMLNQESSSDRKKCKSEIVKSTPKLMQGKSICGDKTYKYKLSVINKKMMKSVMTTHDGKTVEGNFKWKAKKV